MLGDELIPCSLDPLTGYYRTGCCENRGDDPGLHVVCCQVTEEFLEFSVSRGNDLVTPHPEFGFPGLQPGDQWCVCAARWAEALEAGAACPVVLEGTHLSALEFVDLQDLKSHAVRGLMRPARALERPPCRTGSAPLNDATGPLETFGEGAEVQRPSNRRHSAG